MRASPGGSRLREGREPESRSPRRWRGSLTVGSERFRRCWRGSPHGWSERFLSLLARGSPHGGSERFRRCWRGSLSAERSERFRRCWRGSSRSDRPVSCRPLNLVANVGESAMHFIAQLRDLRTRWRPCEPASPQESSRVLRAFPLAHQHFAAASSLQSGRQYRRNAFEVAN